MKCTNLFYMISIVASLFVCSMTYADTCYDPNYNRYYNCEGDEYIAPVVAAVLFSAILSNDNGYGDRDDRHHGGGHDGNRRHH